MIFLHIFASACKRYHVGWIETLYTVQNLHYDNDSEFIQN